MYMISDNLARFSLADDRLLGSSPSSSRMNVASISGAVGLVTACLSPHPLRDIRDLIRSDAQRVLHQDQPVALSSSACELEFNALNS